MMVWGIKVRNKTMLINTLHIFRNLVLITKSAFALEYAPRGRICTRLFYIWSKPHKSTSYKNTILHWTEFKNVSESRGLVRELRGL